MYEESKVISSAPGISIIIDISSFYKYLKHLGYLKDFEYFRYDNYMIP